MFFRIRIKLKKREQVERLGKNLASTTEKDASMNASSFKELNEKLGKIIADLRSKGFIVISVKMNGEEIYFE